MTMRVAKNTANTCLTSRRETAVKVDLQTPLLRPLSNDRFLQLSSANLMLSKVEEVGNVMKLPLSECLEWTAV